MGLIIDRTTFDVLAQDLVGVPALLLHESPADGVGEAGLDPEGCRARDGEGQDDAGVARCRVPATPLDAEQGRLDGGGGLVERGCSHLARGASLVRCMAGARSGGGGDCAVLAQQMFGGTPMTAVARQRCQHCSDDPTNNLFPQHPLWDKEDVAGGGCSNDHDGDGMFVAVLKNFTVVADGVLCQGPNRRITTWAVKHAWHPAAPHGCGSGGQDDGGYVVHLARALLAVGWNGWFWGHFMQDVVFQVAYAVDVLDSLGTSGGTRSVLNSVSFIVEGDSQANVVPVLRGLIAGARGEGGADRLGERVYLMDRECLRGNARQAQPPPPQSTRLPDG